MIAIYREATSRSKSTKSHLLVKQDYSNRTELGKNFGKDNILITFNNGIIQNKILFNRTETSSENYAKAVQDLNLKGFERLNNDKLLAVYEDLENTHFKQIKTYYEATKTEQKKQAYQEWEKSGSLAEQKPKKMQTVYKGKPDQVHKEFLIAFGGADVVNGDPKTIASIDNPDFYNQCIKVVKTQLKEMGLSDRNLVSVIFHRDEKNLHLSCRFSNFNYANCQSLNTTIEKKCKHNKQAIMQFRKNLLSGLQKTVNKSFGFEFQKRQTDPSWKHKTKREWLVEQNIELQAQHKQKINQAKFLDNAINDKKSQLQDDYLTFNFENLAQKYSFKEAKKKLEEIQEIGIKPAIAEQGQQNLVDLFLQFIRLNLGSSAKEYEEEKSSYLSIKNDAKNFIQPTLVKKIDKQITR